MARACFILTMLFIASSAVFADRRPSIDVALFEQRIAEQRAAKDYAMSRLLETGLALHRAEAEVERLRAEVAELRAKPAKVVACPKPKPKKKAKKKRPRPKPEPPFVWRLQ